MWMSEMYTTSNRSIVSSWCRCPGASFRKCTFFLSLLRCFVLFCIAVSWQHLALFHIIHNGRRECQEVARRGCFTHTSHSHSHRPGNTSQTAANTNKGHWNSSKKMIGMCQRCEWDQYTTHLTVVIADSEYVLILIKVEINCRLDGNV